MKTHFQRAYETTPFVSVHDLEFACVSHLQRRDTIRLVTGKTSAARIRSEVFSQAGVRLGDLLVNFGPSLVDCFHCYRQNTNKHVGTNRALTHSTGLDDLSTKAQWYDQYYIILMRAVRFARHDACSVSGVQIRAIVLRGQTQRGQGTLVPKVSRRTARSF
jgi:hypothetical protein